MVARRNNYESRLVNHHLPIELVRRLDAYADARKVSRVSVVIKALEEHLKAHSPPAEGVKDD